MIIDIAYTAVSLSDGSLGLAASPREEGCRIHLRAGELAGMDATELPESPLIRSVGIGPGAGHGKRGLLGQRKALSGPGGGYGGREGNVMWWV